MQATNRADRAHYDAQERVLADADTFQDWFGGQLTNAPAQLELLPVPRDVHTSEDCGAMEVWRLHLYAIDSGQPTHVRIAAMDAIAHRYLAAKDEYVRRIALESMEAA